MFDLNQYARFSKHYKTLKEISLDDSDINNIAYMTNSELKAIDFDNVKSDYCENIELLMSNDALFKDNDGNIIFLEFKNGSIRTKTKAELKVKIYDSLLIFSDIVQKPIYEIKNSLIYILVYNYDKNTASNNSTDSPAMDKISKQIGSYANKEHISFGLSKFKDYCFTEVHTYTKNEFEDYIKNFQ